MKTFLDCLPCMMSQALRAGRMATNDERKIKKLLDNVGDMMKDIRLESIPPETGDVIYKEVSKITGVADPYKKVKESNRLYHKKNLEKIKEKEKLWHKKNEGYMKKYMKKYFQEHKEKFSEYLRYRRKTNLKCNLNHKISGGISMSLKRNKKGYRWESLVKYTLDNLMRRLKKTMPKGYTWQDFLEGKLHIDHIVPIRAFIFRRPEDEELKQCWSLYNLRLLPAKDNISKQENITNPILLGLLIKGSEVL